MPGGKAPGIAAHWDGEYLLTRFVNIHTPEQAEQFKKDCGELLPGLPVEDYYGYAQIFRQAWTAKKPSEIQSANMFLQHIFEREPGFPTGFGEDNPSFRAAVIVDFGSGVIRVKPRHLLDFLAQKLIEWKKRLSICERQDCIHRYFVKTHNRQRFCSTECADSIRQTKKKQWWEENRERFVTKWRRERKQARKGR